MVPQQEDVATKRYHAAVRELTSEEYDLLKEDIATRGIISPIVKDAAGNIVDGYHRNKIAEELGLTDIPIKQVDGTEAELQAMAIALNVCRRQLTAEDRRELVVKLRELGQSIRQIAEQLGVSKNTVLSDLQVSQIGTVERVVGKDGKSRPAQMPRRPAQEQPEAEADPEPVVSRLEQFIALWDQMSGAERLNVYRLVNSDEWRSSRPPATRG